MNPFCLWSRSKTLRMSDRFPFALSFAFMFAALVFLVASGGFLFAAVAHEAQPSIGNLEVQRPGKPASAGPIVFTGDSNIAYWDTLAEDMKPLKIVNSAFGGAQYTELVDNIGDLVFAYRPSVVVVNAGGNDLVTPSRKTPQSVAGEVQQFVEMVQTNLPDTWIYVLSIKPSVLRWHAWPKMREANRLIQEFLQTKVHTQFIDVASPMFDANGNLRVDLFAGDGLHPSAKCYTMWTSIIKPLLLKRLSPFKTSAAELRPRFDASLPR
jgi:lysophospholipase L1-like esterase